MLTNRQVTNLRKTFANHTPTDTKLSKTQLSKMQLGGFLNFLRPSTKTALASAADAGIHNTTLIIPNDEL